MARTSYISRGVLPVRVYSGDTVTVSISSLLSQRLERDFPGLVLTKAQLLYEIAETNRTLELTERDETGDNFIGTFTPTGKSGTIKYTARVLGTQTINGVAREIVETTDSSTAWLENPFAQERLRDEVILDLLYVVLTAKLDQTEGTGDVSNYSLGGRSVSLMSIAEINNQIRLTSLRIEAKRTKGKPQKIVKWRLNTYV